MRLSSIFRNALLAFTGLAMVIIGLAGLGSNSTQWPSVQGQVRSNTNQDNSNRADLLYTYRVNGAEYSGTLSQSSSSYQAGEAITVYYDPANPSLSVLSPGEREWQVWGTLVVGLVCLGWGGWEMIKSRQSGQTPA